MPREVRAVVFDLDDTLYPYRRFRLSGLAAVAAHLADRTGLSERLLFTTLAHASRGATAGRELQEWLERHGLPSAWLPELIDHLRYHRPHLRLPRTTARVLRELRASGWRLGVLTNGPRTIQRAKVEALGLAPFVDVVGYASAIGTGRGKPDPDCFAWMARQLSVPAARTVVVGDSEVCDIEGARAAGMLPVRCRVWERHPGHTAARADLQRFSDLPALAAALVEEASKRHAA